MTNKDRSEKQKSRQQRLRRARARLTNGLSWTRGVPAADGQRWLMLDGALPDATPTDHATEIEPSRELVAASFRTLTNLTSRNPELLAELVEDPELWELGLRALLGHMQALVHDGVPLPGEVTNDLGVGEHTHHLSERLRKDRLIAPYVEMATWKHLWTPRQFRSTLVAIEENRDGLAAAVGNGPEVLWDLLAIAGRGGLPWHLQELLKLADEPSPRDLGAHAGLLAVTLRQLRNETDVDKPGAVTLMPSPLPSVLSYVHSLRLSTDAEFSRRIRLGEAVMPSVFAQAAPKMDSVVDSLLVAGQRAVDQAFGGSAQPKRLVTGDQVWAGEALRLAESLEEVADSFVARLTPGSALGSLLKVETLELSDLDQLVMLIEAVEPARRLATEPETSTPGQPEQVTLLSRWLGYRAAAGNDYQALTRTMLAALKLGDTAWIQRLGAQGQYFDHKYIHEGRLQRIVPSRRVDVLRVLGAIHPGADPDLVFALFLYGPQSVPEVVGLVNRIVERDAYVSEHAGVLAALEARFADPDVFLDVWERVKDLVWDNDHVARLLGEILTWLEQDWALPLAALAELGDDFNPTGVVADAAMVATLGDPLPAPPPESRGGNDGWMNRYPQRFRSDLAALVRWVGTEAAIAAAESVLGKSFPDPVALARQVEALDQRIAAGGPPHMAVRRQALLDRLDRDGAIDDKQIAILERKLGRRLTHARLIAATNAVDSAALASVRAAMAHNSGAGDPLGGGEGESDLELSAIERDVLAATLALKEPYRSLGLEVCRSHLGNGSFNPLDHEPNRRFLGSAQEAGLRVEPWLNDDFARPLEAEPDVTIRIERDPFVALTMGRPFGTCLSPGDFNFWSAVVNAVDINKMIVVGRDTEGRMVCRALVALNSDFQLLAYHPYAHESEWGFAEAVRGLLSDLSEAIEAAVAAGGRVEPVLVPDWYDDGPADLFGESASLRDGSPFADRLKKGLVRPAEVREILQTPASSAVRAINSLLDMSGITDDPDLVGAVLDRVQIDMRMGFYEWSEIAESAARLGRHDQATEIVSRHLRRHFISSPYLIRYQFDLLTVINPILTLRILRQTRRKGVRRDRDETQSARLNLLAIAHQALGRDVLAARLWERVPEEDRRTVSTKPE